MKTTFLLEGLDCANCAAKIERAVRAMGGVTLATVNFMTAKIVIECEDAKSNTIEKSLLAIVKKIEPDVVVKRVSIKSETNQNQLLRIFAGTAVFALGIAYHPNSHLVSLAIFLAAYAIMGYGVLFRAIRNIAHGQVFDENFLMCLATAGAFAIGYYSEGVAVMLFYQVGELFESYAVDRSRKSIAGLMDIRAETANVRRGDMVEKVASRDVKPGEIIVIKPGERIPLDAMVIQGNSALDTSALTGESLPREVSEGSELISGCINKNGLLIARVFKEYGESTASKILELVENASNRKSRSENFITKFARFYTPLVVIVAALLAFLPPLLIQGAAFSDWVYRALVFLVVSCPCALVISIPLAFFGGIGGASRRGILVKGGNYLEALAQTKIVVFDKTGTLTKGVFRVQKITPDGILEEELLETAAYAESYSNHPISQSLKQAYGKPIDNSRIEDTVEIPGLGVTAFVSGRRVACGNANLMQMLSVQLPSADKFIGTIVHIAIDSRYAGSIEIADEIKEDAKKAVIELKKADIKQIVMLTGDTDSIGQSVARLLGIDKAYTGLLPTDKVRKVEELLTAKSQKQILVFVGDGINDAPVLARADIGIAMGALGSDAAIEAADVVIMTDEPSKIALVIRLSQKTVRIAKQNIALALGVKAVVLLLGAAGIASMWAAVFADVGVAILAVLNAIRMLGNKNTG